MKKVLSWILAGAAVFGLGTTAALKTVDAYDNGEYPGPTVNAYGEVVDAEGNPVPGATIALVMDNEFEYAEGQTDENGMVVIPIDDPREQIGYGSMTQVSPLASQLLSVEEVMAIANEYKETQTLPALPAGKMGFYANPSISYMSINENGNSCYIEIADGQRGMVAYYYYSNWSGMQSLSFTNCGLSAYLSEDDPRTYADDIHFFAFGDNEGSTNGSWMVEVNPYNVFLLTDMSLKVKSVPAGYDLPTETIALKATPALYVENSQPASAFSDMVDSLMRSDIPAMYAKGTFVARKTAGPAETPTAPTAPKAQSCQDVGYPADYSWNEELKACVPFAKRIPVVNTSAQ